MNSVIQINLSDFEHFEDLTFQCIHWLVIINLSKQEPMNNQNLNRKNFNLENYLRCTVTKEGISVSAT